MITTLDMIHSKNLIHLKMDPKTIYISDRGLIRFGDIYVPGVAENKCDFFDKFDAPELKPERKYTKESNIYSFGVLIAYILHGKTIFNDDGSINVNKINRSYRVAIKKCINKEPNKRVDFQTLYKILFPTKFQCYSQCIDLAETRYSIFQTIKFQANDLEVVKEISNGIYSRVYLALNRKNNIEIAVKECYVSGKNKFAISPVYQELAALNVLKHPNLIRILGTVTTRNKGVKILMQYANNGDLASRISTNSLKFDDFVEYLVNIGLGMCFMHGRDVIHRDLKPENILICDKRALVSDFNSAAFVSDRGIPLVFGKYGTVKFMAPEVISDYPYSYSCDVFSFGMIICSFYGADLDYLFNQIQTNEANLDFIDNIDLRYLTKRCIEFDSFKRPTFDFICRYLIKKFNMQNYYKKNIFPSRRDPSLISQMKNEDMAGNNQHASDYGRHLMYENKYEEAKIVFSKGSDGDCLNNYAMLLYIEGNKNESIKYFEKASELDNVYALMVIGILNENPEIFDLESDRNIEKALFFYQKAAKEDHNYRCMHLENLKAKYLEGLVHLSHNDIEKANSCFYVATLEFDSDGLNMMGLSIENGTIEEETYDIEDYFRMSASQLNPSGLFNLSMILKNKNPKDSKYYAGLAKLFGGPDITSYRKPKDVLHESWDMHGQLAEMIRGYEVGVEMGDRKSMKKLREMIVQGYGIYKNESCSKNLSDELSFGIEDSLYE